MTVETSPPTFPARFNMADYFLDARVREGKGARPAIKVGFGYATGTNLMFPFAVGGCAVLFPDKPTPARIFEHVEKHGVTVLTNVPAMIRRMIDAPDAPEMSSLRMCLSAGEALPPSLYEAWSARWGHCEILDGIGSAEMFHIYITNYPGDVRPGSLGKGFPENRTVAPRAPVRRPRKATGSRNSKALSGLWQRREGGAQAAECRVYSRESPKLVPHYDARVMGADGEEVADGEIGRLWIKGESSALCYWQDQAKSDEVFHGPWTVSADLFRRDGAYFYYAGRGDALLKVRGMFVSPLEIEDCLSTHEAVREAAVTGVDDGTGLVVPKAYVALREGHEGTDELVIELQQYAKARLARYKFPHEIAFIDALPRNDRGKVVRRRLGES